MKHALLWAGLLVCCGIAMAGDWPQWRGPGRDGKATDFAPPATWPAQLTPKWTVKIGSTDATPALVGDKLYVFARDGADEVTVCLEAATGKEVWRDRFAPGVAATGPAAGHPGPRGSPAVADGKVVTLGLGATVTCLDAATGKVLWRKDGRQITPGLPRFQTACSPLIVDGLAVVQLGNEQRGSLTALDLGSGQIKWQADTGGTAYSSPALMVVDGVKTIVAQTGRSLVGVAAADGKILWQQPTPMQGRAYNAPSPAIEGQIIYYTGGNSGTHAYKVEKTGETWAVKQLWAYPDHGAMFATPVVKDGGLYCINSAGNIYCLDTRDGRLLWVSADRKGERGFGALVDAGPVLVALTNRSELVVFKPADREYTQLASIKLSDAQAYGYPILSGKTIFVEDQSAVSAYEVQ